MGKFEQMAHKEVDCEEYVPNQYFCVHAIREEEKENEESDGDQDSGA